ncbi:MAG: hypothetical protein OXE78_05260 [Gammaproteobacteria bacterium]|nr:hypothetical protein [Gammaproteobacteria bacterium]MCY4357959.1 hypothetical protein [Gammaproteobacteria bacterium]
MSEDKYTENDPEKTLLTLDQLSQTIEVMTNVVNRLRQHLREQLEAQLLAQKEEAQRSGVGTAEPDAGGDSVGELAGNRLYPPSANPNAGRIGEPKDRERFVVEVTPTGLELDPKRNRVLH